MIELFSVSQYPSPGTPAWVAILIAAIGALGGGLGWNIYKRWRTGQSDDALQISQAAIEQARGAKDLFVEYRVELESAQRQISEYLNQLIDVNRLLGEANAKITRLEIDLQNSHIETDDLRKQLVEARRLREENDKTREKIITQMTELQERIHELEGNHSSRIIVPNQIEGR